VLHHGGKACKYSTCAMVNRGLLHILLLFTFNPVWSVAPQVVTKTFHGAGIVVPVDKNDVGYRELPETDGGSRDTGLYPFVICSMCLLKLQVFCNWNIKEVFVFCYLIISLFEVCTAKTINKAHGEVIMLRYR